MKTSLTERMLKAYARHFPVTKGKYRLVEALWEKVTRNEDYLRETTLQFGSFKMTCDISLMLQRQFYFFGTLQIEQENLSCWQAFAERANVVFDVGSNTGIYSLAAVAANPAASIYAFEPTTKIAEHLLQTIARNDLQQIEVVKSAVARETGQAFLNDWGSDEFGNEGMNFVTAKAKVENSIVVPTVALDDYCDQNGISRIDLLKMDIQGNEPEALRGATRLLNDGNILRIFVELSWSGNSATCPATETIRLLSQAGFYFAPPKRGAPPMPAGPWLENLADVIAIHSSAAQPQ